jgi:hypothetical protein
MADEDDREAVPRVAQHLHLHLGHQRAGRVDLNELATPGLLAHLGGDAVRAVNQDLAFGTSRTSLMKVTPAA